ncbi:MAG: hypothetical protein LUD81_10685, partial [Clostridiales bacterium]|nr:hypothetical protein [Clostridiales bacterium]
LFEQFYLYMEIYANMDTMTGFIEKENFDLLTNSIHSFWKLTLSHHASDMLPENASESETEECINSLTENCRLDSDDNFFVLIQKVEEGPTMVLLEMAEDEYDSSCIYIAVMFGEDGTLGYYTLEKASDGSLNVCQTTGELSASTVKVDGSVITSIEQGGEIEKTFLKTICDDYFS